MDKKYYIAIILAVLVVVSASVFFYQTTHTNKIQKSNKPYSAALDQKVNSELMVTANKTRPDYLPIGMFVELPPFPQDLYQKKVLLKYNYINYDMFNVTPDYWLQPEWLDNFEGMWLPSLQNPPANRWGAYGYTVNPGDMLVQVIKGDDFKGEDISGTTFIRSGMLVETYQGIELTTSFPESAKLEEGFVAFSDGTRSVQQDPKSVEKYITYDLEVISGKPGLFNTENNVLILEPSFPIFKKGWASKLVYHVHLAKDIPKGKYVLIMGLEAPSKEYTRELYLQIGTKFVPGGSIQIGRPWYQLFIEVM